MFTPASLCITSVQPFYGKGPHLLLRAGSRVARGKIKISGIYLSASIIVQFLYYIHNLQFTPWAALYNMADRGLETHALYGYMCLACAHTSICHHETCVLNVRLKVNKTARGQMKEQVH
jgi:hypothetical protein